MTDWVTEYVNIVPTRTARCFPNKPLITSDLKKLLNRKKGFQELE